MMNKFNIGFTKIKWSFLFPFLRHPEGAQRATVVSEEKHLVYTNTLRHSERKHGAKNLTLSFTTVFRSFGRTFLWMTGKLRARILVNNKSFLFPFLRHPEGARRATVVVPEGSPVHTNASRHSERKHEAKNLMLSFTTVFRSFGRTFLWMTESVLVRKKNTSVISCGGGSSSNLMEMGKREIADRVRNDVFCAVSLVRVFTNLRNDIFCKNEINNTSSFQNFSFMLKRKIYGISLGFWSSSNLGEVGKREIADRVRNDVFCAVSLFRVFTNQFVQRSKFNTKHLAFIFLLSFVFPFTTQAQDVEQVIKKFKDNKSPLTLSGGVSLDQTIYESNGIDDRRDPYNYFVGGNLNLGVYEWNIPVSFRFSNQVLNYNLPQAPQQPFNQFGLSPSYKWLTLHGGYRNLTYSPLTLSGHQFLGGGVEVAPGNVVKVSTMYGRLLKAVDYDTTLEANFPTYERYGYGLKTEFNIKSTKIALIGFRSTDTENSITAVPDTLGVRPEENLAMSASINQSLGKLSINAEYAYTALTLDKTLGVVSEEGFIAGLGDLFKVNSSTVYHDAIKAGLSYPIKSLNVGINYERVDPGYRTHGAYFFNNDLEKYALSLAFPLLSKKMNVSSNVGIQRNNLDGQKLSSLFRFAGSLNLAWKVSEKLSINTAYSNFISTNNIRNDFNLINNPNDFAVLDTLNYQQIAQSLSLSGSYQVSEDDKKSQSVNLSTSAQRSVDEQNGEKTDAGTLFVNGNASYSLSFKESGFSLALGGNYNENLGTGLSSRTFGPNATLGKAIFNKKVKTSITSAWNASFNEAVRTNRIFTVRGNASATLKKKHTFRLSLAYLNRLLVSPVGPPTFNEFTGRLGYSYRFSIKKNPTPEKKKKK